MTVDSVNSWANWLLLASLIIGVIATYGVVVSSQIKEDKLNLDLSKAKEEASHANERAAELNERAATLEKEAAQARLETERLRTLISWREITETQRITIINGFKKHAFQSIINLTCIGLDGESCKYARRLDSILKDSGLNVQFGIIQKVIPENTPVGVQISGFNCPDMDLLTDIFKSANIPFSLKLMEPLPHKIISTSEIKIWVGTKPYK